MVDENKETGDQKPEGRNTEQREDIESLKSELATLKQGAVEADKLKEQLAQAVDKYRLAVLAGAPGVPDELVKGESVEEIDTSLEKARSVVTRIRLQVEAEAAGKKVPAGAPPRSHPDLSALSPKDKIAYALSRKQT